MQDLNITDLGSNGEPENAGPLFSYNFVLHFQVRILSVPCV